MNKRQWIKKYLYLIGLLIILIAVFFYGYHRFTPQVNTQSPLPIAVKTAPVILQNWQKELKATGTVNARQGIMLKAETAGRITQINVKSGQFVHAGDVLFEINPEILNAQISSAEAKMALSTGDYARAVKLFKRNVLSQADMDTALSKKKADAADVQQLQAQLQQNIIRAPISGKLGLILFNLGDYIRQEQPLANLHASEALRVDFSLPENDGRLIHIGDKVFIRSDAYPGKTFSGELSAMDSAVDPATRTIAVRADIPNQDNQLWPGNFVEVALFAGPAQPYITVPLTAVVYDAANNYIYTIEKEHAIKKPVVIVEQNIEQAALSKGLHPGESVIIEGQLKIGEGSAVYAIH